MYREKIFHNDYEQLIVRAEEIRRGQELFGWPVIPLGNLRIVGKKLELLQRLYGLSVEVQEVDFQGVEYQLSNLQTR